MIRSWLVGLLAVVAVVTFGALTPNCNDPEVWGTASGVEFCAINGGK